MDGTEITQQMASQGEKSVGKGGPVVDLVPGEEGRVLGGQLTGCLGLRRAPKKSVLVGRGLGEPGRTRPGL